MMRKRTDKHAGLKSLAFALIILAGFELTLTILESNNQLEEPYDWRNRLDIGYKINQCIQLFKENPEKIKVLVIGDSRVQQALWSRKFDSYFNNRTITYNLAFPATGTLFQSYLLRYVGLPKMKPDVLIWDFSHTDVENTTFQINENSVIFGLPASRYYFDYTCNITLNEAIDYFLMKTFRIYRYRTLFYYNQIVDLALNLFENGFLFNNGTYHDTHTQLYNVTTFSPDLPTLTEINETRRCLIEKNILHLVISPPHNYARFVNVAIQQIYNQFGQQYFLDLNGNESLTPDVLYYNEGHLNPAGAEIYTRFVCEKLNASINALIALKGK